MSDGISFLEGKNNSWMVGIDELRDIRKLPIEWLMAQQISIINKYATYFDYSLEYYEAVLQLYRLTIGYVNKPTRLLKEQFEKEMNERLDAIKPDKYGEIDKTQVLIIKRQFAERLFETIMLNMKARGLTPEEEIVDVV